ncbi:NAD-dependent dehydratase [Agreia sp. Leaf244]|uniref:NAD(P)H-binding protein n=1 Tax=Agreia sp. Leaf244 TaxID=1736305 RepID=UPI0006FC45AC|nr:NAD(P)H-binding protein [Agreia sp. Leaf244]KQO05406.1 NAD-dependent dehydratase [Agreia sp. Leaf244]
MNVFVVGITGGVGMKVARRLRERGDNVAGLIRHDDQKSKLSAIGADGRTGDLVESSAEELAGVIGDAEAVVFTAGAGGSDDEATTAIDRDGVIKTIEAASLAGVSRLILVSVFPEAWRDRNPGASFEHYILMKKEAEVAVTHSDLDWVIVRPSALQDHPGRGRVVLGPAEIHAEITRDDIAATIVELVHQPRISRNILEVSEGDTPIAEAVASLMA